MTEPKVPHIVLTGADLAIADVEAVARGGASVSLDANARERMTGIIRPKKLAASP